MKVIEAIQNRRSIRLYQLKEVEKDKLQRVLEAARLAPSAANKQPWAFIVLDNPEVKEKLRRAYNPDWFVSAPIIIVACGLPHETWRRRDGEKYWKVDVAIALQNLVLAAWEEGLGTCWVANFNEKAAKKVLGIPRNVRIVAMTPLGYPAESKEPVSDRKTLEEIVHYNQW